MARPGDRKLSRRTFLTAGTTLAVGGGAALVFGCSTSSGQPTPSPKPSAVGAPRRGGEIVIGTPIGVISIDPHIDAGTPEISQLVYTRLYTWDAVNQIAIFNDFAEGVEMPDPDLRQFIFTLRRGVKIHSHPDNPASGEDLTSEDCKQSFIRRATAITAPDKRLALTIAGTGAPDAAALSTALQTPDPYTFSFNLTRPFSPTFRELAKPEWSIMPAKVIVRYGESFSYAGLGKLFGSGPFMLNEFRGTERISLIRHPEYFLAPRPWLDRITFLLAPSRSRLVSGLKSGQLDAITPPISGEEYLELKEDGRFTTSQTPTLVYPVIHLKMQPPFDDIRVREAIDLTLNRDRFADEIWGGEAKYNGPIAWPMEYWALPQDELRSAYPHDPDRAKALLEESGYSEGFTATMTFPRTQSDGLFDIEKAASLIADDLSEVRISLKLEDVELGSFISETLLPGHFEMAFFPSTPYDEPDRPLAFYHTLGITGVGNWNNYTNAELDRLIEAQSLELDEAKRQEILFEAQRLIIQEHGPQITLPSGYEYHARRSYIHYPYEIGEPPSSGAGPWGSDIWTEKA
jgi:peptide/nickel transport system substrate-binding protein